ncbi:MAG: hypothetical protein V4628_01780 [Pseudomonadota bacterium]
MFIRTLTLISGLAFSLGLNAATEFENGLVPLELARDLNGGGGRFYKTLPDNFPLVALPAGIGLTVIGSIDRGTSQAILLRNAGTGADATAALLAAYTAHGWINIATGPRLTLCHDQQGIMDISSSDAIPGEHRVYVQRSFYPIYVIGVSMNCAQQLAYSQNGGPNAALNFIRGLLPTLALEDVERPYVLPSIRISGVMLDNFSASTNARATLPDATVAELHEGFIQQLEAQGWRIDSGDAGEFSATAVAFKTVPSPATETTPAKDVDLTGFLTVLNTEDDKYLIQFALQSGDGGSFGFIERGPLNSPSIGIRGIPNFPVLGIQGLPAGRISSAQ